MNIIQVCPYDLSIPGGVQTHITYLSNQLVRRNHNVRVFAPSLKKSEFETKLECKIEHITGSTRVPWLGTSIDISVLKSDQKNQIKNVFSDFKPDVIHFHTIWNPVMQTQLLRMTPESVKKVGTFHDTPPDRGLGKYIGANLMKAGVKYYLPKMDEIISVSETQTKAMGVDPNRLPDNFSILPNGIDAEAGRKLIKKKHANDEFRIIFIGRFESRKGVFDLLEVYKQLADEQLNKKISLKLVGQGAKYEEIKNFVKNNGLTGVTFHQDVGDVEKDQLLLNSDLMVAPALYGESFGIVLLEAMALGTKVAAYGNEGYMTIGSEYGAEHFPPPGDKETLFKLIKRHITNPELTEGLIKRGLEIAACYDWKLISAKIEKIYQR